MGVEFLTINVLLHTKSEQKVSNILITICVGRVWIVTRYFLFEKQAFDGLLKVIGIQNLFFFRMVESLCKSYNDQRKDSYTNKVFKISDVQNIFYKLSQCRNLYSDMSIYLFL